MVVDSSALIAAILDEPDADWVLDQLAGADAVRIGAATMVETGLVLVGRSGIVGKSMLARLVEESGAEIVSIEERHWTVAVDAFARFGKGRHQAALNFGDCLTYAVARVADEPLLCIGNDFSRTDLELVHVEK